MIPLEEARDYVLSRCKPLAVVTVKTVGAVGCVAAVDTPARCPVPPFANSAMDGYALRAGDVERVPVTLEVVGTSLAGSESAVAVGPGQAVRIMTGAAIPEGADAVCMVENTRVSEGGSSVTIQCAPALGENVRPAGDDVAYGATVIPAGTVIGPTQLAALISAGCDEVAVYPRPTVGVISTGDELAEPGMPLGPGQIYDSNRPMLVALVEEIGAAAIDLGRVGDDESAITERIERSLDGLDALVLSGGVSVGDVDFVTVVLDTLGGGSARSMKIAIRPARPFAFALLGGRTPAFGLPGNPVSAAVSFELLVRPALLAMAGHREVERETVTATALSPITRSRDGKVHFVRVRLEKVAGGWAAEPCPGQGSHQIHSMALADGLAVVPDGEGVPAGGSVEVKVTAGNP